MNFLEQSCSEALRKKKEVSFIFVGNYFKPWMNTQMVC